MIKKLLINIIAVIFFLPALSSPLYDTIPGTWKGISLCQVMDSPCNNEIAVYHIATTPKYNIYKFTMNKIVNGKETDMGILDFEYYATKQTFVNKDEERQTLWTFKIKNDTMDGTLMYRGTLYRIIKLHREH